MSISHPRHRDRIGHGIEHGRRHSLTASKKTNASARCASTKDASIRPLAPPCLRHSGHPKRPALPFRAGKVARAQTIPRAISQSIARAIAICHGALAASVARRSRMAAERSALIDIHRRSGHRHSGRIEAPLSLPLAPRPSSLDSRIAGAGSRRFDRGPRRQEMSLREDALRLKTPSGHKPSTPDAPRRKNPQRR